MPSDNDPRDRSASPARDSGAKKSKSSGSSGGFKWKSKAPRDEAADDSRNSGRLERGYRDRSPMRDTFRDRDGDHSGAPTRRDDDREDRRDDRFSSSGAGRDSSRSQRREDDGARKEDDPEQPSDSLAFAEKKEKKDKKDKKDKKAKKPPKSTSNEPMIVVNINDRLGTKAAIPCLASDSVKAFKAIVAANIGRQPHEIMLKRQGERPFKDQLTLEDYGVSHGVQLDLELDTGD
ncbi:hypothetical protein TI39_contig4199g00024 [Zymoseptoria brevis]|uniref:Ubiquitin-like modifier HUB1 n=1 Tax=Zymoseptoria brevis TaxID=1047168 RepID=A0A0F4GBK1_9PEZI|nr:hypothetical protein TI39_contig4199g00024 [Zymoseptoria brevis]